MSVNRTHISPGISWVYIMKRNAWHGVFRDWNEKDIDHVAHGSNNRILYFQIFNTKTEICIPVSIFCSTTLPINAAEQSRSQLILSEFADVDKFRLENFDARLSAKYVHSAPDKRDSTSHWGAESE